MTVALREIDESNFYQVLALRRPEGEEYVAPNNVSLAEAWLYRDEDTINPQAIYDNETLVGFVMTHDDLSRRIRDIWRMLIPVEFENQGYGTMTLQFLIAQARAERRFDALMLSFVPVNSLAQHVYHKVGFVETGAIDDGEVVMGYRL
jgi:diamine N-acetyltransferase